jgi:DNA-binding NtrC family response regulator
MPSSALPPLPSDADLRRLVHFSAGDGRIWLAGQRMLLLHAAALGGLRRELMNTLGRDATRRLLLRAGYAAGERDAALAQQVRSAVSLFDRFAVGPQLHMLEGAVQVTPERFEADPATGHYLGVYRWDHSWEVETHLRDFGPQTEPVCWMLLGYASGYTSAFFGQPILYKETACAASGAAHCLIEGRPLAAWPDGAAMAEDYAADSMLIKLENLTQQVETLRSSLEPCGEAAALVGSSRAFRAAIDLLHKAAGTLVTVLLTGETGVGKERFARALHALSARAQGPFVAVNCAALPGELIESELFGSEKGAYTGAATRPGRFERADGGTLLLDELGELPLPAQAKLLRVLQTGEVERLGATSPRKVDVRVVAATNVDLDAAVAAGRFRRDLMYRLNVYPIRIPPLRERIDDIEPLAAHLLQRFVARHGKRVAGLSDRALDALRHYPWPGNVRELENVIERGVILANPGVPIDVEQLFATLQPAAPVVVNARGELERQACRDAAVLYDEVQRRGLGLDALEDALIHEAVTRCDGNLAAAARALGLTRPQLSYRLQRARERAGQ